MNSDTGLKQHFDLERWITHKQQTLGKRINFSRRLDNPIQSNFLNAKLYNNYAIGRTITVWRSTFQNDTDSAKQTTQRNSRHSAEL
jgi:hypothetical protein